GARVTKYWAMANTFIGPTSMKTLRSQVFSAVRLRRLSVAANSSLKLTVRLRLSRRPSRLPRLEFARRRATCTGIIGCAASGAPLDTGRPPAARNLTSGRWADDSTSRAELRRAESMQRCRDDLIGLLIIG